MVLNSSITHMHEWMCACPNSHNSIHAGSACTDTSNSRARVRGVRSRTSWTISRVRLRIGSGFGPCALRLCAERLGPIAEAVITKAPCNAWRVALGFMLRHSIAIEDARRRVDVEFRETSVECDYSCTNTIEFFGKPVYYPSC